MGNQVSQSSDLLPGDVIYRNIDGIQVGNHYGVYVGDGIVIDFSKESGVHRWTFDEFARNYEVSKERFSSTLPKDEIVETAWYYLKYPDKWGKYSLATNNCEHFATYCATGNKKSGQVRKAAAAIGVGISVGIGAVIAVAGGAALIAASKNSDDDDDSD